MAEIIGVGQLALMDLNDAIVSGTPPSNPVVGTLWIDESQDPVMLKKWNGEAWIDLGELDPDISVTIEEITETLGNMANDNIINFQERQVIKDKLTEIIGYVIADTATTLPTVSTLDNSGKGSFWSVRKSARNIGIPTNNATYVNVATRYNNLKSYLESLKPIAPWDTRNANADVVISVVKSTFRDVWLQYYLAVDALAELTAQKIKENENNLKNNVDTISNNLNDLTGRVANAETSIAQNANQIELKANKTDVYTKTEINSQFSTVNQQISQLGAELTVQADQISQRVTKTEFLSNISDFSFERGKELWSENNSFTSNVSDVNATVKNEGITGGKVLELTGNRWVYFKNPIPVDTSRIYRVRFRVRQIKDPTSGGSAVYAGVATYDKNGNLQTTSPGTHRYCAVSGTTIRVTDGWKYFEGTITGEGNTSHNQFRQGTAYVKPMFVVNYNGGNGIAQVDLIEFKDITEEINAKNYTNSSLQPVNTRLSTAETSITQLSNQIQLKANQSTVDTLTGQVSNIQSQLTIQANQIATKVEKNGVISAINQTPESIKIQASKVDLSGYVTFTNLSTSGQTTIDGANLKTGSITANKLNINNIFGNSAVIGQIQSNAIATASLSANQITSGMLSAKNNRVTFDLNNGFLNINEGAISIKRPDGAIFIQDGVPNLNYNVQAANPSFTHPDIRIVNEWFRTNSTTARYCNLFTFRHEGRYLKVEVAYRMEGSGTSSGAVSLDGLGTWSNIINGAKLISGSDTEATYYTFTVDLGVPTYTTVSFYVRLRTSSTQRDASVRILRAWQEG